MKKTIAILNFSWLMALCLSCPPALAQKITSAQSFIQLSMAGNTVNIENLSAADVLGTDNKIQHNANFEITVSDNEESKAVLAAMQLSMKENKKTELTVTTVNYNGDIQEERNYREVMVQEMLLPQLDATAKSALKIKIKVKAEGMKLKTGGGKAAGKISGKARQAMAANFRIKMGNLPANRIVKISSMNITVAGSLMQNFSLDVAGADGTAWNNWFLTGAGGIKKEDAVIELLSPDFKVVLITIALTNVEIVSYATTNSGGQQIAKANIGLRSNDISIKF